MTSVMGYVLGEECTKVYQRMSENWAWEGPCVRMSTCEHVRTPENSGEWECVRVRTHMCEHLNCPRFRVPCFLEWKISR